MKVEIMPKEGKDRMQKLFLTSFIKIVCASANPVYRSIFVR